MIEPAFPENESQRQREVEKYNLLDTLPEESYDSITSIMASICETPISLVSLLDKDRNFLKSHHGIPFNEDPRSRSFCGHAILSDEPMMIIQDAMKDERFHDNPLVTEMGVRFYAGAQLVNPNGFKLGTLCVFDMQPKELNEFQKETLQRLAKQVMYVMENHLKSIKVQQAKAELEQRNEELKKFAAYVSHDLKSPLSSIFGLSDVLMKSIEKKKYKELMEISELIQKSSYSLASYIDGVLDFYTSDKLLSDQNQEVSSSKIFKEIKNIYSSESNTQLVFDGKVEKLTVNQGVIMKILINLISNGMKYNMSENRIIKIKVEETGDNYTFEVSDNGIGMTSDQIENAFELFETNDIRDRNGNKGTGIGLATVKKMIDNLQGKISITSDLDRGSTVSFSLPKE